MARPRKPEHELARAQAGKRRREREQQIADAFRNPENPGGLTIEREGLLRRRMAVPKAVHHLLTERQRTVLRGKPRMARAWVAMNNMLKETGMSMQEFVEGLTVEELVRGRLKDTNGQFRGRPPKFVPREFQQACIRELFRRGQELWQKNYLEAIQAMTDIAAGRGKLGEGATPGERIKAAQFVIERLEGKVPDKLVVTDDKRWETVLSGIVADVSEDAIAAGQRAIEGIVEGEVLDVDYDDDYDDPPVQPVRSRRRRKA
jgi:hypothetical protein